MEADLEEEGAMEVGLEEEGGEEAVEVDWVSGEAAG